MSDAAFLGTGLLASGMIEAMLRLGRSVTVWNRTASKARALEALGAKVADTPEAAVQSAREVHIVLSDDAAVDAMLERVARAVTPDTVVVDHSTTSPAGTKERLRRASSRGMKLLHAPVFMSPQMCRDAQGLMMVSGPAAVYELVREPLAKMTGEVWYVGEREDLAAAYKIFGNSMLFVITAGLVDVFAMAKNLGVPAQDAVGLFSKFRVAGVIPARGEKIARGDFEASFELTMARKDIRLMIEAAGAQPLTVLPSIAARMDEAIASGHGKDDLAAIGAAVVKPAR
jgi:3-hydroxyisobutyrate dehydrogenase-like beta-hydroxyacid dehydrogenase